MGWKADFGSEETNPKVSAACESMVRSQSLAMTGLSVLDARHTDGPNSRGSHDPAEGKEENPASVGGVVWRWKKKGAGSLKCSEAKSRAKRRDFGESGCPEDCRRVIGDHCRAGGWERVRQP